MSNKGLKISAADSEECIGSAISGSCAAIHQLREQSSIVLTATALLPESHRQFQYVPAWLRIVLYGFMSEKQLVAKTLSDGDLYLQHPSLDECDRRVPYFNPHYFLRPGRTMPELASLRIPSPGRLSGTGSQDVLSEHDKRQLLQMFESAHDPKASFGIRPSPRLQSALKGYVPMFRH